MKEIIFRGKRTDNCEWAYGVPTKDNHGEMVMVESTFECEEYKCRGANCLYVDENTVGQYTGLTDKNGKKIFEGDIVRFDYSGENKGVEGTATVLFQNGQFGVLWGWHKEFVPLTGFCNTTIEIIGNIHDNPELLTTDTHSR